MSFTNFPNGITSFGIPCIGGLPPTFGNVWFVDYARGSDAYDGKSPTTPFKTLSAAHDACVSNNNDFILINGYATVQESGMINFTKSRVHVFGCNGLPPGLGYGSGAKVSLGVTTDTGDIATILNTGVRNTFTGLKFGNSNTLAQALYCVAEGGEYTRYNYCEFYKSSQLDVAAAAELLLNGDSCQFYGCTFGDLVNERGDSAKQRPNVLLNRETVTGKVARDCAFVDCTFLLKAKHADVCFVYGSGATDVERRLLFIRPIFWNCSLATADPADGINFAAAQTAGDVLVVDHASVNVTMVAGASLNVYVQGAVPTENTTGKAVEVTT